MTRVECSSHAGSLAAYHCDGCGRLLCEECIEIGHRLFFCHYCGERALPLAEEDARDAVELSRQRSERKPSSIRDALAYPFRGLGGYVFWGTFAVLGAFLVIESVAPLGFLVLLVPRVLVAVLLPGLLFAIVRSTARGEEELPDWPDWFDGERLREFVSALVVSLFTLLPAILLLTVAGCGAVALLSGGVLCWLLLAVGLGIGLLIWIPAFAAVAAFGPGLLSLRLDLHVRAFFATRVETVRVGLLMLGLGLAGEIVALVLSPVPLVGAFAALGIDLYALFVGTHLIGLLLRRHERVLEPIYCY